MGRWTRVGLAAAAVCGALLASASARAQVVYADVGKNLEYQQTSASTVVPYGAANAFLFGRTFYKSPGDYTDGTFTPASSGTSYAYNI